MNRNHLIIIFTGFFIRNVVAIFNFFLPKWGGALDSARFHNCAGLYAGYDIDSEYWKHMCQYFDANNVFEAFYVQNLLSSIYLIFGHNRYFGNLFSVFIWLISAMILVKILNKLNIKSKYISYSLIFYCFVPAGVFYSSVILREPMQLLLINLSMFFIIYFFYDKKIKYLIGLLITFVFLVAFHRTFIIVILFLLVLFFIYLLIKSRFTTWILLIPIMFIFYYIGIQAYLIFDVKNYFHAGFYEGINTYQDHAIISGANKLTSRSQYIFIGPEIKNTFDFLLRFIPKSLFKYFLEPIPFVRSINFKDFYFTIENFVRFFLVLLCFKNIFTVPKDSKLILLYIFLTYMFIETMWSVGTMSWGTASRHHVISYGLLSIAAFYIPKKRSIFDK